MVTRSRSGSKIRSNLSPRTKESNMADFIEENDEVVESHGGSPESASESKMNRDVIENIPVTLAIEVGRATLKIRDLMRLTQGSVVELDRLAGEPLDIVVNDTVVAQGEVVLVNDRYGVRLTQVISAADRIKNL
ncbi:MAG: flagellar motor switch protein FliN [Litorivicinaceae bacterium]|nr:flagellar motor switch protein FliN [Litorivicinaceae bacterium]MDP5328410.1 flagellar motor switch protein FliN [Litorivicinaceae bacterium]MDP5330131.1 flagellar motor switch protein FliN [Litorivicinaceae bacterium]MDP5340469.1 flagellar motor switch protein FliN [Litorivicinaceae bacterium]MDP5341710.1 flagellar motor switch protein FliN [Litorivicinaceae bacterium]